MLVFGDSTNDIKMLELFESSFIPSNGHQEALNIAKTIIGDHNEDCVAKVLEDLLL